MVTYKIYILMMYHIQNIYFNDVPYTKYILLMGIINNLFYT